MDPKKEDYFTFIKWDGNYKKSYSIYDLLEYCKKISENNDNVYLIYTYNFDEKVWNNFIEENEYKELYVSPESQNENYIIYEIKK